MLNEGMLKFFNGFRYDAHPMGMFVSSVAALSTFYPEAKDIDDPDGHHRHIGHLYAVCPGRQVHPTTTPDLAEAARVSGLYSIPDVYTDFRELLARDDIEAVDVCLHNNFHMPVSVAALRAGKHVYCEKMMSNTIEAAASMVKTGRKLTTVVAIAVTTALVNLIADLMLVPRYGELGAAWGTLIAFGLMLALTMMVAKRRG